MPTAYKTGTQNGTLTVTGGTDRAYTVDWVTFSTEDPQANATVTLNFGGTPVMQWLGGAASPPVEHFAPPGGIATGIKNEDITLVVANLGLGDNYAISFGYH